MGNDDDADDAFGNRFAAQPQLLQPPPRFLIDRYLPIAIWQLPGGLVYFELDRNQGAAFLANFNIRHRSGQSLVEALLAARSYWRNQTKSASEIAVMSPESFERLRRLRRGKSAFIRRIVAGTLLRAHQPARRIISGSQLQRWIEEEDAGY